MLSVASGLNSVPGVTVTAACTRSARTNSWSGTRELRQSREQIAARLGRPDRQARHAPEDPHEVIANRLMLRRALGDPLGRLLEPAPQHRLRIAGRAQRDDGLELLHAIDEVRGAKRDAEPVAAERFGLRRPHDRHDLVGVRRGRRAQMRVGLPGIQQARIELVDDDRDAVLRGQFRDARNLSRPSRSRRRDCSGWKTGTS